MEAKTRSASVDGQQITYDKGCSRWLYPRGNGTFSTGCSVVRKSELQQWGGIAADRQLTASTISENTTYLVGALLFITCCGKKEILLGLWRQQLVSP
jgi:hypothetical protein